MSEIMKSVDQRTQLVGQNRLELLLFQLNTKQTFGINVFKVKEVLNCPELTSIPHTHPVIRGVAYIRGHATPIIDLNMATGGTTIEDTKSAFVIVAEYNKMVTGFMVDSVDRIINLNWSEIHPPPKGTENLSYLTAIAKVDEQIIEILDVELILAKIYPPNTQISESNISEGENYSEDSRVILIADDSAIARKQVQKTITQLGLKSITVNNGLDAFKKLKEMSSEGSIYDQLIMVISDIEMPEMDGYTFTTKVRADPDLNELHILLHSSLSGDFNKSMVEKVGAEFIPKFDPDMLAAAVLSQLKDKELFK